MSMLEQVVRLDMKPQKNPPHVDCTQYDSGSDGWLIRAYLFNNGSKYVIPSDYTAKIEGTTKENTGFTFAATIDNANGVVTFALTDDATAFKGSAWCKIVFEKGTSRIATSGFWLDNDRAGVEAETVIGADGFETQIQNAVNDYLQDFAIDDEVVRDAVDDYLDENGIDTESITTATTDWLDDNVNPVGSAVVVDSSLTVSGAAADAKVTGENLRELRSAVKGNLPLGTLINEKYIKATDGTEGYDQNWSATGFINITSESSLVIEAPASSGAYNAFYNSNKAFISAFTVVSGRNVLPIPSGAVYARLSNKTADMEATAIYSTVGLLSNKVELLGNDLLLRTLAEKNGYYSSIPLEWESGSIVPPNGVNKNPDIDVIRTPLPRMQLNGDIRFVLLNNKYKVRLFEFSSDSGQVTTDSGWIRLAGVHDQTIDTTKYYRFQITVDSAASMDAEEALKSVLIVYADDTKSGVSPYWDSYIESKVQSINNYMTNGVDKTAFLFLTDTHWNRDKSQLNHYGINTSLMKYVADRCNIDYLIHGGDLNCEYRSNRNIAREMMTEPMAMMRSAFANTLVTRGNHDDNNESGNTNWAYTITQSDSYSYMFRNTADVVFGETGTYFYHDIPFEKVRIISLDCVDFPYTNDVDENYLDEKLLAYGYTQLQWLCDVLRTTPNGYHIVIYTHAMLAPSAVTIDHPNDSPQTRAVNYGVVCDMLKAYKNRVNWTQDITGWFTSIHQSYYDGVLNGDFSACDASIVGVFSGHEHIDCIEEILDTNGNGIGIYNTCTQNSSALFGDSVLSHTYQHPMEIGTTSELVWDMVVIDKTRKHVDMIRIGANGANTDVETFNVRSFDYV